MYVGNVDSHPLMMYGKTQTQTGLKQVNDSKSEMRYTKLNHTVYSTESNSMAKQSVFCFKHFIHHIKY